MEPNWWWLFKWCSQKSPQRWHLEDSLLCDEEGWKKDLRRQGTSEDTILRAFISTSVWFAEREQLWSTQPGGIQARPRGVRQPTAVGWAKGGQRSINKSLRVCCTIKGKTFKRDSTASTGRVAMTGSIRENLNPWKFIGISRFTVTPLIPGRSHQKIHLAFRIFIKRPLVQAARRVVPRLMREEWGERYENPFLVSS